MVQINLLPRGILEKRKYENLIGYVILIGVALVLVVGVAIGGLMWVVGTRNARLQQALESSQNMQEQAEAYKIFEEKEETLSDREDLAAEALAKRIDWGRMTNELSLVLPSDVWLYRLEAGLESLEVYGYAIDSPTDIPDVGHKSLAKMLIRLADLEQVTDVWLSKAEKGIYSGDADIVAENIVIDFLATAVVIVPESLESEEQASVPAPPDQSTQ